MPGPLSLISEFLLLLLYNLLILGHMWLPCGLVSHVGDTWVRVWAVPGCPMAMCCHVATMWPPWVQILMSLPAPGHEGASWRLGYPRISVLLRIFPFPLNCILLVFIPLLGIPLLSSFGHPGTLVSGSIAPTVNLALPYT